MTANCDACSEPVDTDPNGDAHSDVTLDDLGYVTGELWWHPECCPFCSEGHEITQPAPEPARAANNLEELNPHERLEVSTDTPHSPIEFVDEAPSTRPRNRWEDRTAAELQQRPGEWAVVRRATQFSKASPYVTFLRRVGCEAHSRRVSEDEIVVYARWPE